MSKVNSGYQAVYSAALKALETDPYQEVAFSVATSQSACQSLAPEEDGGAIPALHLYLWNETLVRYSLKFVYVPCTQIKDNYCFFNLYFDFHAFFNCFFPKIKVKAPPRDL
jgi:hypothetical protein